MGEVRLQWGLSLLDLPLSAVEHLVHNILTTGAGSIVRLPQGGPLDQQSAIHALTIWFNDHGKLFPPEAQKTIDGIISWLGCTDAESLPDLYATAAGLIVLSYGSWDRKANLLFSLFGFGSGGPKPPTQLYKNTLEEAEEPLLAPDELALLIRSVCAGLYSIGLGSSFAPPGMDSLARIAADAMEQINDKSNGTMKRGLTKADFQVWVARSPDAIAGLERLSLLPRLRLVIEAIQRITNELEKKLVGSADRLSKLPGAPAPRGTVNARARLFHPKSNNISSPGYNEDLISKGVKPLRGSMMKEKIWPVTMISQLTHCEIEFLILLPPRNGGEISITIHLPTTSNTSSSSSNNSNKESNSQLKDGCLVRGIVNQENCNGKYASIQLGELTPTSTYRFVVWYDDQPCPTSFKGYHSRCFTTLPPPPFWGPRSYWPELPVSYSSSPSPNTIKNKGMKTNNTFVTPDVNNSRHLPYELTFICAGLDLLHDHTEEGNETNNNQHINPSIRLMLGLPRDDGDVLLHRAFYNVEKTLQQYPNQKHDEFNRLDIETAKNILGTVILGAFERCLKCVQASSHMRDVSVVGAATGGSSSGGGISEREESATMFMLKDCIPNEWRHRYPYTTTLLLQYIEKEENENKVLNKIRIKNNLKKVKDMKKKMEQKEKIQNMYDEEIKEEKRALENPPEDGEEVKEEKEVKEEDEEEGEEEEEKEGKEDGAMNYFCDDIEDINDGYEDDNNFHSNDYEVEVEDEVEVEVEDPSVLEKEMFGFNTVACGPMTIIELGQQETSQKISHNNNNENDNDDEDIIFEKEEQDMIIRSGGWHEENIRKFLEKLDDDTTNSLLIIAPLPLITAKPPSNIRSNGWSLFTSENLIPYIESNEQQQQLNSQEKFKSSSSNNDESLIHKEDDFIVIKKEIKNILSDLISQIILKEIDPGSTMVQQQQQLISDNDADWESEYEQEQNNSFIPVASGNSGSFNMKKVSSQNKTNCSSKNKVNSNSNNIENKAEKENIEKEDVGALCVEACAPPKPLKSLSQSNNSLDSFVRIIDRLLTWTAHGGGLGDPWIKQAQQQTNSNSSMHLNDMMDEIKEHEEYTKNDIENDKGLLHTKEESKANQVNREYLEDEDEEDESLREVIIVCHDPNATEHHVELTFTRYMSMIDNKQQQHQYEGEGMFMEDDHSIEEQISFIRVIILAAGTNHTNMDDNHIHPAHHTHHLTHHHLHHNNDEGEHVEIVTNKENEEAKKKEDGEGKEEGKEEEKKTEEEEEEKEEDMAEDAKLDVCPLDSTDLNLWREAVLQCLPQISGMDKCIEVSLRTASARCDGKSAP